MTATFERLNAGDRIWAPPRTIPETAANLATTVGGYTHPLFTDAEYVRTSTPFATSPLPGPLVLFLLGGMAEQSDAFDETTVALVGIDNVRFANATFAGDTITLEMEVLGKQLTASGRSGTVLVRWHCVREDGTPILTADVTMLCRVPAEDGAR